MVKIPSHAKKRITRRGISEIEVIETVERGEIIMEEMNKRVGLKKYSKMRGVGQDLIVIWFFNKKNEKEVATAYWRGRRL